MQDEKFNERLNEKIWGRKHGSSWEKRKTSVNVRVRSNVWNCNQYEKEQREFLKKYNSFGSKMRRLLVDDDGLDWSWRAFFEKLLWCKMSRLY